MASRQFFQIIGYLGRDPEMRYTPSGVAVTNFSVAATERWTDDSGTAHERTIWVRVATWRRLAEVCNQYLKKGRLVMVEGRLVHDGNGNPKTFQRQDGTTGAAFEMNAITVLFLDSNGNGKPVDEEAELEPEEESIPF